MIRLFWLRDSGFVTFKSPVEKNISKMEGTIAFPTFSCLVLTAKGLEVLKKVPKSLDNSKGIGEEIIEAVKIGAKDKLSELVSIALSFAFKNLD